MAEGEVEPKATVAAPLGGGSVSQAEFGPSTTANRGDPEEEAGLASSSAL
jgi:hypothetical protein